MKRRALVWSRRAEADLVAIGDFIALDDPKAAHRWVGKLMDVVRAAARLPFAGRRVPEFQREDIREIIFKQYRIVYRVTPRRCTVLTVFERHRLLPH